MQMKYYYLRAAIILDITDLRESGRLTSDDFVP